MIEINMYNFVIIEKILNDVYSYHMKDYSRFYIISKYYKIIEYIVEDNLLMYNTVYSNLDLFFKIKKFNKYVFFAIYSDYYDCNNDLCAA